MSHNKTTIPLPEEISGHSSLPLARIKKIIRLDDDIAQCSNNAAFVIAVATEMFITYLAEQGHNVVKSERKPRRTIQYKDLATAVSRIDNLEFLADVIPKTTTYKKFKEKRAKENAEEAAAAAAAGPAKGQRTLHDGHSVESVLDNAPPRERKEDLMLLLNGDGHGGVNTQSSPRGPVVVHASGSQSAIVQEDNVHMADA